MPCDRCGGAVETYELRGREALACRECGYVDTPVRHEPESTPSESWRDAIDRFQEKYATVTASESVTPGSAAEDEDPASESEQGASATDTEPEQAELGETESEEATSGDASEEPAGERAEPVDENQGSVADDPGAADD